MNTKSSYLLDAENLGNEITQCISRGTEGDFWDFKQSWHSNNSDLLHDIICMANNPTDHDGYIIIGVEDKTGKLLGNLSTDTNKKTQQNVIDFLKDKKFAGGYTPRVYVRTVSIFDDADGTNKDVDVIIVKNTDKTPYFLSDDYQGVFKGNIYTRGGDTNTPKVATADFGQTELLWRRRFGIDKTAIERVKLLLSKPEDWYPLGTDGIRSSSEYRSIWYNKYFPEFTIYYEREESFPNNGGSGIRFTDVDYYWLTELDKVPEFHDFSIYDIGIKMHATTLFYGRMIMDCNGKYCRMWWKSAYLFSGTGYCVDYAYIEKDSIEFLLDDFLANCQETIPNIERHTFVCSVDEFQKYYFTNKPYNIIPVFKDAFEHNTFQQYVESRQSDFLNEIGTWKENETRNGLTGAAFNPEYIIWKCKVGETIVSWLTSWRNHAN